MTDMPAISLVALPGRVARVLEVAVAAEEKGFSGVYVPSMGPALQFCQSVLEATTRVQVATSIQPIYYINPREMARIGAYLNDVGGGRFSLGLGISHEVARARFGVQAGKPLADVRDYVGAMREAEAETGPLPPIVLATLRNKMLALAGEIAQGAVWANAARSYMPQQLASAPSAVRKDNFFVGDMIPTVIDDDREAAKAVHKKTLQGYLSLPNYRNYWREAGYGGEMDSVEEVIAAKQDRSLVDVAGDGWLADVTLFGNVSDVREGVEACFDAGVTPILVPSSTSGGQAKAAAELFAAFS